MMKQYKKRTDCLHAACPSPHRRRAASVEPASRSACHPLGHARRGQMERQGRRRISSSAFAAGRPLSGAVSRFPRRKEPESEQKGGGSAVLDDSRRLHPRQRHHLRGGAGLEIPARRPSFRGAGTDVCRHRQLSPQVPPQPHRGHPDFLDTGQRGKHWFSAAAARTAPELSTIPLWQKPAYNGKEKTI